MNIIEYINYAKTDEEIIFLFKNNKNTFKYKYLNNKDLDRKNPENVNILIELKRLFKSEGITFLNKKIKYFNYFKGLYYFFMHMDNRQIINFHKKKNILMKKYFNLNIKLQYYIDNLYLEDAYDFEYIDSIKKKYNKILYYNKKCLNYVSNNMIHFFSIPSLEIKNNLYFSIRLNFDIDLKYRIYFVFFILLNK